MPHTQPNLAYAFIPAPYPIRASVGKANPNVIDLQVMIGNPGPPVAVESISIRIPMGSADANDLSMNPALPDPTHEPYSDWVIESSNDVVTIKPNVGGSGELSSTIIFVLKDISVNESPGFVPITITEIAPTKFIDSSHRLEKLEADFPVTNFFADPSVLHDVARTTLHWGCSDQGDQYVYSLRSVHDCGDAGYIWRANDCLGSGDCLSCQDGADGIETPELGETTVFALDVIKANAGVIHKTLCLTVPVEEASISDVSYLKKYFSGRLVSLHWLASNATRCRVEMDGTLIDDHAPTSTYHDGYFLTMPNETGTYELWVFAIDQTGNPHGKSLDQVKIEPPVTFPIGRSLTDLAITPDGKRVFGTDQNNNSAVVIDLNTGQSVALPVGKNPRSVAITPDGHHALVGNSGDDNVTVIDIATGAAVVKTIPVGGQPTDIATTPDGKLALVTLRNGSVSVINLNSLTVETTIPSESLTLTAIAITPDGKYAFAATFEDRVAVIDVVERHFDPAITTDPTDYSPTDIAITPDGTRALVVNNDGCSVRVVDINNRKALSPVIPSQGPSAIAITPDGKMAIVACPNADALTVIDLANLQAPPLTISVGPGGSVGPSAIVISPSGNIAAVANYGTGTVTLL